MIAIILPTRGFVFTQVEIAIERERKTTWEQVTVYRSSDLSIPYCLDDLVSKACEDGATHFWFIEEDTVPPEGSLKKLLYSSADISFIDYGVQGWSCSAESLLGDILWCGFGCTMVKASVFDRVSKPWFVTDQKFRLNTHEWVPVSKKDLYGGHDIWFFYHAKKEGCIFEKIEGECDHLSLVSLGAKERNNGLHTVVKKPRISMKNIVNL